MLPLVADEQRKNRKRHEFPSHGPQVAMSAKVTPEGTGKPPLFLSLRGFYAENAHGVADGKQANAHVRYHGGPHAG